MANVLTVDRTAVQLMLREVLAGEHPAAVNEPAVDALKTIPTDLPVNVDPDAQMQVALELPPVDDDEYHPTSMSDLSKAAYAVATSVPADKIELYYHKIRKLANDLRSTEMTPVDKHLRMEIKRLVAEAGDTVAGLKADWEEDKPEEAEFSPEEITASRAQLKKDAYAKVKPTWSSIKLGKKKQGKEVAATPKGGARLLAPVTYEEPPKHNAGEPLQRGRKYSWEDIQTDIGASTPTTGKQMAGDPKRAMDKLAWIHEMPRDKLAALKDQAVEGYIDELKSSGALEDAEAKTMLAHPEHVTDLGSFRTWAWSRKGPFRAAFNADIESGAFKSKKYEEF